MKPIYVGERNFLGFYDLVVSIYSEKCRNNCSFCSLGKMSSDHKLDPKILMEQIDYIFLTYQDRLDTFQQLSIGNEGSILNQDLFYYESMNYLFLQLKRMNNLQVLSLESRAEYIDHSMLQKMNDKLDGINLDVTVGFETQNDIIRNDILRKKLSKSVFENRVEILGALGIRLTCYVMLKPSPYMSEEEGVTEVIETAKYLKRVCEYYHTELIIYLNPTYISAGTDLSEQMVNSGYTPPTLESIKKAIIAVSKFKIPIYTGLSSESKALRDWRSNGSFNKVDLRSIRSFNVSQDVNIFNSRKTVPML